MIQIAVLGHPEPGPYDRDVEILLDTSVDYYRIRFVGSNQFWVNPQRMKYRSDDMRTRFPDEQAARDYIARVYTNFTARVERA